MIPMKSRLLPLLEKIIKTLAKLTLKRYKPGIIGITGNVGKTSAKEAIRLLLERERKVRANSKNFNNEFGLPLTILGNWKDTEGRLFWIKVILSSIINLLIKRKSYPELLILEYGIDRPGDMRKLLEIARPHIGVVTAIGKTPVHVEFFAGKEGVIREKARMISQLPATGFAVLNADDEVVLGMRDHTRAHGITFGYSERADIKISNLETQIQNRVPSISFKLNYGGSFVPVRMEGVLGKTQTYAAGAAAVIGVVFGMNLVKIAENLGAYKSPKGRMNVLGGIKNSVIIDDTYNSSPLAAKEALETLKEIKAKRKIAVLGDMLELGKHSIEEHENIGNIVAKTAKILITVGAKAKFIGESAMKAGLPKKSVFICKGIAEAFSLLTRTIEEGDMVLVKGSQSVRMEYVVKGVMEDSSKAEELLVRQSSAWLEKPPMYK